MSCEIALLGGLAARTLCTNTYVPMLKQSTVPMTNPIVDFVLISISQSLEAECALMLPRHLHPYNNYYATNRFGVRGDRAR